MSIVQNFDLYAPKLVEKREFFCSGHRACQGCGEVLALRHICKALGDDVVVSNATGCMEIISTFYPHTAWEVPWIHVAFENAAAVGSGVESALKVLRRKGKIADRYVKTVAVAGDGGTVDIGLQSLSGAMERGHDLTFFCLDNEAYMNTGIQRSSATPFGAATTTSPAGKASIGQKTGKKNVPEIMVAHNVPYVATACPSYPIDLMNKVEKAKKVKGPAYIHVFSVCPTGWRAVHGYEEKIDRSGSRACFHGGPFRRRAGPRQEAGRQGIEGRHRKQDDTARGSDRGPGLRAHLQGQERRRRRASDLQCEAWLRLLGGRVR